MNLDRSEMRLNVGSWVWLLVVGAIGIAVLTYEPHDSAPNPAEHAASQISQHSLRANTHEAAADSQLPIDIARSVPTSLERARHAKHDRYSTRNIEDIRVGDRVLASNPEVSDAERSSWKEPDWLRWMKLSLVMPKPDGSELKIEMLRPEEWVISQTRFVVDDPPVNYVEVPAEDSPADETEHSFVPLRPVYYHMASQVALIESQGLRLVGLTVEMDLPELGLTGDAILVDIEPLTTIQSGAGRVVTATFHHAAGDVIDLVIAGEAGDDETIGTTGNHPFWSVDRHEYVQAGTLESGERVLTFAGDTKRVASKLPRPGPEAVYNLEVHGEHVFFVGQDGLLVHNSQQYTINQMKGRYGAYKKTGGTLTWAQYKARNSHRAQGTAKTTAEWLDDDPKLLAELRAEFKARPRWQGIDPDSTPVFYRSKAEVDKIRGLSGESGGHHPHGLALGGPEGQTLTITGDTKYYVNPDHSRTTGLHKRLINRIRKKTGI